MRTTYETALVRVKGHIRSRKGEEHTSFPPLLYRRVYGDFTQEKNYFITLFDLVLTLYGIAFDDPIVRDLREKLQGDRDAVAGKTFRK